MFKFRLALRVLVEKHHRMPGFGKGPELPAQKTFFEAWHGAMHSRTTMHQDGQHPRVKAKRCLRCPILYSWLRSTPPSRIHTKFKTCTAVSLLDMSTVHTEPDHIIHMSFHAADCAGTRHIRYSVCCAEAKDALRCCVIIAMSDTGGAFLSAMLRIVQIDSLLCGDVPTPPLHCIVAGSQDSPPGTSTCSSTLNSTVRE